MWATYTSKKEWFIDAVRELNRKGLNIIVMKRTIVIRNRQSGFGNQTIIDSESEFKEFIRKCGINIDFGKEDLSKKQHRPYSKDDPGRAEEVAKSVDADGNRLRHFDEAQASAKIQRLTELGRLAVQERDAWKKRALEAEDKVSSLSKAMEQTQSGGGERKFNNLRRLIAYEIHPDHCQTDGIEKEIKSEIFKRIWSKIDEINRS